MKSVIPKGQFQYIYTSLTGLFIVERSYYVKDKILYFHGVYGPSPSAFNGVDVISNIIKKYATEKKNEI